MTWLIVNPMGRILVPWKSFRNNLEMLCHPICNGLYQAQLPVPRAGDLIIYTGDLVICTEDLRIYTITRTKHICRLQTYTHTHSYPHTLTPTHTHIPPHTHIHTHSYPHKTCTRLPVPNTSVDYELERRTL